MTLNDTQKKQLLDLARASIQSKFDGTELSLPDDPLFAQKLGLFVTLHIMGELRGCIGYIRGYKSLADSVVEMARAAAFQDSRFYPVSAKEMADLEIEISILGEMQRVTNLEEIQVGRHGLYLDHPRGSGLLLPQVAVEWDWDRTEFLKQICRKAGVHKGAWHERDARLYMFEACVFSDAEENEIDHIEF